MQSLIKAARESADDIVRKNWFFKKLEAGDLDDMDFVYRLRPWCGIFIDALFSAAVACKDPEFKRVRREHAVEEGRHPGQLDDWMRASMRRDGMLVTTNETRELGEFVSGVATTGTPVMQVLILNVFAEYMAKVTFQAVIKHFGSDVLHGRYWHVHEEVDEVHSLMGVDLVDQSIIDEHRSVYEWALERCAYLFDRAIASWA
jgi:hypothetical protein